MFLAVPLEFRPVAGSKSLPLANYCLIAANVLVWLVGWQWIVGRDLLGVRSGPFSILLYGFSHAGFWHLVCNMWILWVFGNAVNRRLGHGYYLAAYVGSIVILGLFAWLLGGRGLIGASGGIFAIMTIALMLMPSATLQVAYVTLFPLTLLLGALSRPKYGLYWFVRGGELALSALWCLLLIPVLELCYLLLSGGHWTHLGHLFGMLCGLGIVLLLPTRITMGQRSALAAA